MSAMAQLKISVEEDSLIEESCRGELRKAMDSIEKLQKELRDLRARLAEKEHLAEQKKILLRSASAHEQILRSALMQAESFAFG